MDAPGPLAVRGTPAELDALVGQRVESIRRRGKFLLIDLERDAIACNPMLTGRFQLAGPGDKIPAKTAVVLGFGPRSGGPADAAAWTAGADWLPADEARAEVRAGLDWNAKGVIVSGSDPSGHWVNPPRPMS